MGKVKTVVIGDIEAEEKAKKAAEVKREQKKLLGNKTSKPVTQSNNKKEAKSDVEKAQEILKMMAADDAKAVSAKEEKKVEKDTDRSKQTLTEAGRQEKKSQKVSKKTDESAKSDESVKSKTKHGKKYLEVKKLVDKTKHYSLSEAIDLVKKTSYSKFEGTIEAHFNVSVKGLRGTVQLPHGTGKTIKVAVASDSLLEEISAGKTDFDILIAHPSMMPKLAKVAKVLGPKGLMPNPKTGTISEDTERLALSLSKGQTNWKTEPDFPIVHTVLGKASFDNQKLEENYLAIAKSLGKDKIKSVFLKATMGPSVKTAI